MLVILSSFVTFSCVVNGTSASHTVYAHLQPLQVVGWNLVSALEADDDDSAKAFPVDDREGLSGALGLGRSDPEVQVKAVEPGSA